MRDHFDPRQYTTDIVDRQFGTTTQGAHAVMLAEILVAIGTVGAATGFILIGTSLAIVGDHDLMTNVAWVLMIGGVILAVLGSLWYRSNEAKLEEAHIRR